jgi:predicted ATP-dependent Lon-type protease
MEFYDVNFSYKDLESFSEEYVSVLEQCSGKLIPDIIGKPGLLYRVG